MLNRPADADPLAEALHLLRMSGIFYVRSEFTAPWGLALPPLEDFLSFHVVTQGECWLEVPGAEAKRLRQGDLALIPHGAGHRLLGVRGTKAAKLFDLPHEHISERYAILRHGGGGAACTLICGTVRFDHPAARTVIAQLPKVIAVDGANASLSFMHEMLRFMAAEARALRPGSEEVITRLADILVIQAIRAWIEEEPAANTGFLGALRDEKIGRAIALMHRFPERDWTLATLASEVAMSRSAFAARFTELTGEPAMHYLAKWRMQVATAMLREDANAGVGEVAERLGYQSEAAFSRAFKRFTGHSPGAARRQLSTMVKPTVV